MINDQSNHIPDLSESIEFSKLTENEYILSNYTNKHYLKINRDTYNLLDLIDGKHSVSEIRSLFNTKFNKQINLQQVEYILFEKLSEYGVLKGNEENIKPYQKPMYLKLSFIIFSEELLSKIVNHFNFLFKPLAALLVVLSSITIITLLSIVSFDFYKSFNLQDSILCLLIIKIISTTFHEVGHASAANFYGAKHGGIGGGFYLFTPVYFADVTDVWRLKKWQRIVVNFSGMYFEFIFCSILAVIAFIAKLEVLTLASILVCISTLFNLNPFLRGDGYWILSDLISKPNLRKHSLEKIKDFIKTIRGKRILWNKIDVLLFFYGITSYAFIGMFLHYVLVRSPRSVLNFPVDAINFIKGIFDKNQQVNLEQYGNLIIQLIFYYLIFTLIKAGIRKGIKRMRQVD